MFTPNHTPEPPGEISDLEWEIRTGRAIYILEQTLPDFFQVGLVDAMPSSQESIYSPAIRLTYTPPAALPAPFPSTLSLDGLALYMASSVFIRHTMKTLYADLRVEMQKLAVQTAQKREKSVLVGLTVYGTTRVSGGLGEWQVASTYRFSPVSGLINRHSIDSIQPAPHEAAWAALSHVFGMPGDMRPGPSSNLCNLSGR